MLGIGCLKDEKRAKKLCLLGVSKEFKLAKALQHFFGFKTEIDKLKAYQILNEMKEEDKRCEKEITKYVIYMLGRCHYKGDGCEINLKRSVEYLELAGEMGVENALNLLAIILTKGDQNQGVEKNVKKSIEIYEKLIENGYPSSMNNLAIIYERGDKEEGLKKDMKKALELYQRAIDTGNSYSSILNLAIFYTKGDPKEGIKKDLKKAIELYKKGVEIGNSSCINNLAILYQDGDEDQGIQKDILKSIDLYQQAIKLGNPQAMHNLALVYEYGIENPKIEKDLNKCCSLYYQCFSIQDKKYSKSRFLNLIQKHQNEIIWKKEYHFHWQKESILNQNIFLILLISKHRKEFQNKLLTTVFLKGISFKIIQFLCHLSPIPEPENKK